MARMLFGEVNPSGKLPETFPKHLEDNPSHGFFPGQNGRVSYGEGIYVGYRHYDTKGVEPLFPFGFGLSYTQFAYSDLTIERDGDGSVRVALTVTNPGDRAGAEIVQLYVSDLEASVDRPSKELKGFTKVQLLPGQTKRTELVLPREAFAFFSPTRRDWVVEPGAFELLIGSSSRDIRLRDRISLE
jgi:beta-glucosidase